MKAFEARFAGKCAECGEQIHAGDAVRYSDDLLMHDECAPNEGGLW